MSVSPGAGSVRNHGGPGECRNEHSVSCAVRMRQHA
jgi:hypothetical protein